MINVEGTWKYKYYKSKVATISKRCTKLELDEEIYDSLNKDYNMLIMKYLLFKEIQ